MLARLPGRNAEGGPMTTDADYLNGLIYGKNANGNHPQGEATAVRNTTDLGNAERLIDRHGEDLKYVHAWGGYLLYDGQRWAADQCGAVKFKAAETVRNIYHEAGDALDKEERKALASHAKKSESQSRIEAMLSLAEHMIAVKPGGLDLNPWLLNVENGTVDLCTGELHLHQRDDLITKLAPVEYDPDATAPNFEAFLEQVLPSEDLRRFVQRAIGYSLTGDVSEQVLLFMYGAGANGKSTLINVMLAMLGEYGMQAAPELLTAKPGTHPTELADLQGARLAASVEVEDGRRLAESLVKQLTGGDRIKARFMRQDFFEFEPTHKVVLAANHKPTIRGTDHAIWRRIKLVPFEVTIPKAEQDPHLFEKLRAELPGILAWAVRGCLDWQQNGLGEPEEVRAATAEYRAEMDVIAAFLDERCVVHERATTTAQALYDAYTTWCDEYREKPEKQRSFGLRLTERGFGSYKITAGPHKDRKGWRGIGLRADDGGPDDDETGRERNKSAERADEADEADDRADDRADNHPLAENGIGITETANGRSSSGRSGPGSGITGSENAHEGVMSKPCPLSSASSAKYAKHSVRRLTKLAENGLGVTETAERAEGTGRADDRADEAVDRPLVAAKDSGRRLTADEARQVQKLMSEGMEASFARAAVLGEEVDF